ncbi:MULTISPECIES: YheC/YheD family endospore coat-associated protein [Heyndrickxia]|uniref:YheC/YheD family endospore coat-associated protein n=1 Tax=Heyndrickxia TaxID=2837504 RepID=UPI000CE29066|nr:MULTISPECIES: YheC/YheD family protein [Heyndrickxia]AVD55466.1 glutathione synthetase [Heyndrickxia coagulans]AWP36343.1 glutathione synthetase [Heyndrickxia coagulans]MED4975711.1 YheC/YheD family protein [Weizmannia sp. CD-2023]QDI61848.1 YheC/YheD family protein [Heyndrickxia coagulans]
MASTIAFRHDDETKGAAAEIPRALLSFLHISNGELTIRFGGKTATAKVETDASGKTVMMLSADGYKHLKLPVPPARMRAFCRQGALELGPVIAVLTELTGSAPSENIRPFCEELHNLLEKEGGYLFVEGLDSRAGTGCTFSDDRWKTREVPEPDIVYNRIHSRLAEKSRQFEKKTAAYKEKGIDFFNAKYLTKMEVYECLYANRFLRPYLPETCRYGPACLAEKLEASSVLYVKPENGSQGRGIIRIEKKEGRFLLDHNTHKENSLPEVAENVEDTVKKMDQLTGNLPYILQQGIPLLSADGRQTDFRFLVWRTGAKNDWQIASSLARTAADDAIVSNLSQGGLPAKPVPLIFHHFGKEKGRLVLELMHELAEAAAITLCSAGNGHFAEFGIDIGVDREGKPWVIEANVKPSKAAFGVSHGGIRPSVKALYRYGLFLWTERGMKHAG